MDDGAPRSSGEAGSGCIRLSGEAGSGMSALGLGEAGSGQLDALGCQGRLALWMMVPSVVRGGWICRLARLSGEAGSVGRVGEADSGQLMPSVIGGGWLCRLGCQGRLALWDAGERLGHRGLASTWLSGEAGSVDG